MHHIAVRPKIISYTYMVKWIIYQVDISNREFKNNKEVMGSFSLHNLQLMYNLLKPQILYKKQFLEKFFKENEDPADVT